MPHFMVDDQFHLHRKTTALIENEGTNGVAAIGLWTLAGSQAQAKLSDGAVTIGDATRLLLSRPLAVKLARLLVKYELWEPNEAQAWLFHDWRQFHKPGAQVQGERDRRRELRTPEIVNAVRARDGDACRYCGKRVNWSDRKGERGGCYDHVDPGLVAGSSNIVVACRSCNSRKARRSPEQAGMTLLPPPGIQHESNTGSGSGSRSDLAETTSPRERVRGRARAGSTTDGNGQPGEDLGGVVEPGITTGLAGEVGRAGPVPPGSVPPPAQRPSPVGSGWHGWNGPAPDVDLPRCETHGLELPCRACTDQAYREDAR